MNDTFRALLRSKPVARGRADFLENVEAHASHVHFAPASAEERQVFMATVTRRVRGTPKSVEDAVEKAFQYAAAKHQTDAEEIGALLRIALEELGGAVNKMDALFNSLADQVQRYELMVEIADIVVAAAGTTSFGSRYRDLLGQLRRNQPPQIGGDLVGTFDRAKEFVTFIDRNRKKDGVVFRLGLGHAYVDMAMNGKNATKELVEAAQRGPPEPVFEMVRGDEALENRFLDARTDTDAADLLVRLRNGFISETAASPATLGDLLAACTGSEDVALVASCVGERDRALGEKVLAQSALDNRYNERWLKNLARSMRGAVSDTPTGRYLYFVYVK